MGPPYGTHTIPISLGILMGSLKIPLIFTLGSDATFADSLRLEEDPSGCGRFHSRDVGKCFCTLGKAISDGWW